MSNIRKYAAVPMNRLHLRDTNGELLYADGADGEPDKNKPMIAVLYGHGSKQHSKWITIVSNRFIQRLQKKGAKVEQTEKENRDEKVEMLLNYTQAFENVGYDDLTGEAAVRAVYEDPLLGFIGDQVAAYIADWSNFSPPSSTTSSSTSGKALT